MKRSGPLKRKTPLARTCALKRSPFRRKPPPPNRAGSDPAHLAVIRALPCAVCGSRLRVAAHHSTVGRGLSRKTSDHETLPLCSKHHREFHDATGYFAGWDKRSRRDWQRQAVEMYRPKESA